MVAAENQVRVSGWLVLYLKFPCLNSTPVSVPTKYQSLCGENLWQSNEGKCKMKRKSIVAIERCDRGHACTCDLEYIFITLVGVYIYSSVQIWYNQLMQCTSIFMRSEVFGKVTDKQFHGQVWSVPSLLQDKWSRFKVWNLLKVLNWHLAAVWTDLSTWSPRKYQGGISARERGHH